MDSINDNQRIMDRADSTDEEGQNTVESPSFLGELATVDASDLAHCVTSVLPSVVEEYSHDILDFPAETITGDQGHIITEDLKEVNTDPVSQDAVVTSESTSVSIGDQEELVTLSANNAKDTLTSVDCLETDQSHIITEDLKEVNTDQDAVVTSELTSVSISDQEELVNLSTNNAKDTLTSVDCLETDQSAVMPQEDLPDPVLSTSLLTDAPLSAEVSLEIEVKNREGRGSPRGKPDEDFIKSRTGIVKVQTDGQIMVECPKPLKRSKVSVKQEEPLNIEETSAKTPKKRKNSDKTTSPKTKSVKVSPSKGKTPPKSSSGKTRGKDMKVKDECVTSSGEMNGRNEGSLDMGDVQLTSDRPELELSECVNASVQEIRNTEETEIRTCVNEIGQSRDTDVSRNRVKEGCLDENTNRRGTSQNEEQDESVIIENLDEIKTENDTAFVSETEDLNGEIDCKPPKLDIVGFDVLATDVNVTREKRKRNPPKRFLEEPVKFVRKSRTKKVKAIKEEVDLMSEEINAEGTDGVGGLSEENHFEVKQEVEENDVFGEDHWARATGIFPKNRSPRRTNTAGRGRKIKVTQTRIRSAEFHHDSEESDSEFIFGEDLEHFEAAGDSCDEFHEDGELDADMGEGMRSKAGKKRQKDDKIMRKPCKAIRQNNKKNSTKVRPPLLMYCRECGVEFEATHRKARHEACGNVATQVQCHLCQLYFHSETSLLNHMQLMHVVSEAVACVCGEIFYNRREVRPHQLKCKKFRVMKGQKRGSKGPYECKTCHAIFNTVKTFTKHMKNVHNSYNDPNHYICKVCGKEFPRVTSLINHEKYVHSSPSMQCPFCVKKVKNKVSLLYHVQTHREIKASCDELYDLLDEKQHLMLAPKVQQQPPQQPLMEQFPSPSFAAGQGGLLTFKEEVQRIQQGGDVDHLDGVDADVRGQPDQFLYHCPLCEHKYNSSREMKEHIIEVHGIASRRNKNYDSAGNPLLYKCMYLNHRYLCQLCGKKFHQKNAYNDHLAIHSGKPTESCKECGRDFITKTAYQRHMRFKHMVYSNGTKILVPLPKKTDCPVCGKTIHKSGMRKHMDRHDNIYRYTCSVCGKKCRCHYDLQNHERTHTGEQPFGCAICGRKFNNRANLRHHEKRLHNIETPKESNIRVVGFHVN